MFDHGVGLVRLIIYLIFLIKNIRNSCSKIKTHFHTMLVNVQDWF
jgi:hypothetical protein